MGSTIKSNKPSTVFINNLTKVSRYITRGIKRLRV